MARVRVSARAEASITRHDDWLRSRDPRVADRLLDEIERLTVLLSEHSQAGQAVEGTELRSIPTRRYRYRLIHRLIGDDVEVVDILHPSQSGL